MVCFELQADFFCSIFQSWICCLHFDSFCFMY